MGVPNRRMKAPSHPDGPDAPGAYGVVPHRGGTGWPTSHRAAHEAVACQVRVDPELRACARLGAQAWSPHARGR
jgi:hypothetical protein